MVRADPTGINTVMRAFPARQNCHSEAFGCQWSSRRPPGLMMFRAAAIFLAAGKLCESTTRTSPPLVRLVGAIASILKVYWMEDCTLCPPTADLSSASDFRRYAVEM